MTTATRTTCRSQFVCRGWLVNALQEVLRVEDEEEEEVVEEEEVRVLVLEEAGEEGVEVVEEVGVLVVEEEVEMSTARRMATLTLMATKKTKSSEK